MRSPALLVASSRRSTRKKELGATVPASATYGLPSSATSVTRERSRMSLEIFLNSIHSSENTAAVPPQANSLMMSGCVFASIDTEVEVAAFPAASYATPANIVVALSAALVGEIGAVGGG